MKKEKDIKDFSWWKTITFSALITTLAFFLSHFIIFDIFSSSIFSPLEKSFDFELPDVYNSIAQRRSVSTLNNNIAIVKVDGISRDDIAHIIRKVDNYEPSAIILDVMFIYPSPSDTLLIEVCETTDNLILPVIIEENGNIIKSYFYDYLSDPYLGAVNIAGNSHKDIIRNFKPFFSTPEGSIPTIDSEALYVYDKEKYNHLLLRNNTQEIINYPSTQFYELDGSDILDSEETTLIAEILKDKLVYIGNIDDPSDFHLTPIETMSGLEIHAHTLDTMIQDKYIDKTPTLKSWIIAIIACYIFIFCGTFFNLKGLSGSSLYLRFIQIAVILSLIIIGSWYFLHHNFYLDFAPTILMISFGTLALDIFLGCIDAYKVVNKKLLPKLTKNKSHE